MSGDPYFAFTSLLLPMTADFTDVSASPKVFTAYGNAAISNAQSKWGAASGYFDGSGDYLETPYSTAFHPGNDSFTIEMWVRPAAIGSAMTLFANRWTNTSYSNYRFYIKADGRLAFDFRGWSFGLYLESPSALVAGQWQHVAFSRDARDRPGDGTARLFIDGKKVDEEKDTYADFIGLVAECSIGRGSATIPDYFSGHLQDVRFTTGIARYINEFTPPAAAFPTYLDLSCNATLEPVPLTCAPAAISGPAVARLLADAVAWDREDGGAYKIIEQVTRLNTPARRRVRLCDQTSGRLVREAWSSAEDGGVTFDKLRSGPWLLYVLDHTGEFEAEMVSDRVATLSGAQP